MKGAQREGACTWKGKEGEKKNNMNSAHLNRWRGWNEHTHEESAEKTVHLFIRFISYEIE